MEGMNVYVAGPVLRPDREHDFRYSLRFLYGQIEAEAKLVGVVIQIPYYERELDHLEAREFAKEITRRIELANAMLVVLIHPEWSMDTRNYSVACEAQIGAAAGKPVAFLAYHADQVPRLLRALAREGEIYTFEKVDFQQLFQYLAQQAERQGSHNW